MKVELNRNSVNRLVGYKMIAENEEDKLILGSLRNLEFWGEAEDKPQYDGIKVEPAAQGGEYVVEVNYNSPAHKKAEKEAFYASIKKKNESC